MILVNYVFLKEISRVFLDAFGSSLREQIRLIVADGVEFCGHICSKSKQMTGLKKMMGAYAIKDDYFIFFEYFGRSTFYVCIYNNLGMEIFNKTGKKLFLGDIKSTF